MIDLTNTLVIIPARKGSKGIPGKNKKVLAGKPLIEYTIEAALGVFPSEKICLSTDDIDILKIGLKHGIDQKILRPISLSTDNTSAREVILHEVYHCGRDVETIIYLQPTSPMRKASHIREALDIYNSNEADMVVSVSRSKSNPYFNMFEENKDGFLTLSKQANIISRQHSPEVFEYNGAIYIINCKKLKSHPLSEFKKVKKYLMTRENSIDIDDNLDWITAETLITNS